MNATTERHMLTLSRYTFRRQKMTGDEITAVGRTEQAAAAIALGSKRPVWGNPYCAGSSIVDYYAISLDGADEHMGRLFVVGSEPLTADECAELGELPGPDND